MSVRVSGGAKVTTKTPTNPATQAEADALLVTNKYISPKTLKDLLDTKQAPLVSGTNIKTINSVSILGSGDLVVGGGAGSGDVVGPASATDSNFAAFDSTTGKLIKDSTRKHSDYATAAQGTLADAALPSLSYTAADVLTKIKTVDGTGSGLDADTIDGQEATAFQATLVSATNIKTINSTSLLGSGNIDTTRTVAIQVACSDLTTSLTTGASKAYFRMPYALTLTEVRCSVLTAPTGSVVTVDINEDGTTILSTKLTIDATELTSQTAATPAVISDAGLADDAAITIDIDTVGASVAGAGLVVTLVGNRV